VLLYRSSKSELAPQEDQGFVLMQSTSPPNATLQRKAQYDAATYDLVIKSLKPITCFRSMRRGCR